MNGAFFIVIHDDFEDKIKKQNKKKTIIIKKKIKTRLCSTNHLISYTPPQKIFNKIEGRKEKEGSNEGK